MDRYQKYMWLALACFLAICVFFLIHNAHWLIGDEAIVIAHTGMGKAFSPLGFDGMVTSYGRLYPFAYTLYNILLPFFDGCVPPVAIYTLHGIALVVFATAFALLALHLLRSIESPWKYAVVFFFVVTCVFRVYTEYITCYSGVWIVYLFLPLFLLFSCRFMDSGNWGDGIVAIIAINYIIYCYETVFTIPLAIGLCSIIFSYRRLSPQQRVFNSLLIGSGLLFLLIYAIVVLPNANSFYQHYGTTTFLKNASRMFLANKIYWFASIILFIRCYDILIRKNPYTFCDSLLLSSFAYFIGAAVLKLNYTYYYNVGALVGLTASLFFIARWLKPNWICIVMLVFALFYGRKIPGVIQRYQEGRVSTFKEMSILSSFVDKGENLFWYEPVYDGTSPSYLDMRETSKIRIEQYLGWMQKKSIFITGEPIFNGAKGIWFVYDGQEEDIPTTPEELMNGKTVFSFPGIIGYQSE